jgi:hypothetical protein
MDGSCREHDCKEDNSTRRLTYIFLAHLSLLNCGTRKPGETNRNYLTNSPDYFSCFFQLNTDYAYGIIQRSQ